MPDLSKALIFLRSPLGKYALRILAYSRKKDRSDKPYLKKLADERAGQQVSPGKLADVQPLARGARFFFANAALEIVLLAPDLARISWEPGEPPSPYAVQKTDWPDTPVQLLQIPEGWQIASSELRLWVQDDGGLQFFLADNTLIRQEAPPVRLGAALDPAWRAQAALQPEERLYGLGLHALGFNLRGTSHRLVNTDPAGSYGPGDDPLYMSFPVMISRSLNGSYLIFYENPFPGKITSDPLQEQPRRKTLPSLTAEFDGGMLRYYLIPGPLPRMLERYSELTGRAPLPPRWSLGYHQSRWGYRNEADVREVVAGFREHDLPLSAIHLDIDYMQGYRVFTVDSQRFPDMASLCRELDEQGIKVVAILDPGVKVDPKFPLYRDGLEKECYIGGADGAPLEGIVWPGRSVFPDFTNPKTRQWWGAQYLRLTRLGVRGFWHDMNEPTALTSNGEHALPQTARHDLDGRGGNHRQARNLYGLLMNRAGWEGLHNQDAEQRPWLLSRSGWASGQRYAWNWTGDTASTWQALHMTISQVLTTGLCGLPYNGPDIGGFSGNPSAELYLRWFQMSAFLPFFRTHSALTTQAREPWRYGEPYTSIVRRFLRLRYQLIPYWYTLAWQASQSGAPLVRPLFWSYPGRQDLWDVDDVFLLGDHLLIAPITEEGQTSRRFTLPPGGWYDFWTGQLYRGPGLAEIDANLETIPVLARAGCILPLEEEGKLALNLYSPLAGAGHSSLPGYEAGQLYCDAGDGYGAQRLDRFVIAIAGNRLELVRQSEGEFPFPYAEVVLSLHGWQAQSARVDGKTTPLQENRLSVGLFNTIEIEG